MTSKNVKVLALLSGGLDSTLATKIILDQNAILEAVHFTTPFCNCNKCTVNSIGEKFCIEVHQVLLGQEFLDLVVNPPHGYGSQMNPCIDCRILMLKKAKEIAQRIGANCIVTGEVLNERPFSQRKNSIFAIEREAGLEGTVLRPLSAKLLPETEFERNGMINREKLFSIQGRRRIPQIELAKEYDIKDYPCPSGGCLLTDPQFANRLREFLQYNNNLTLRDVTLLKIGRHFRVEHSKVVVGRDEAENKSLLSIAKREKKSYLEVVDYMGPITLLNANDEYGVIDKAAEITVRYSDAPKDSYVDVRYMGKETKVLSVQAAGYTDLEQLRV